MVNEGSEANTFQHKKKNKKTRSKFVSNAKGFAKQGIYGRGTQIEEEDYTYFINILDAFKKGFESTDEKVAMANNVFEQTVEKETHFASNQIISKVLETLIAYTDSDIFERFIDALAGNLRPICSDNYASHVVQKTVEIAFLRAVGNKKTEDGTEGGDNNDDDEPANKKPKTDEDACLTEVDFCCKTEFSDKHRNTCGKYVVKIGKFLLNNLEDFYQDMYANHIIRTSIDCLAGLHIPKIAFERNFSYKNVTSFTVGPEWTEIVEEYATRLELWPQFPELVHNDLSASLLGHLCIALKTVNKNKLNKFGKKILTDSMSETVEGDDTSFKVFDEQSSARLLEILLYVSGSKLFTQIHNTIFEGRVGQLAKERTSNYAVQKLIENIKEKSQFEDVFTDIVNHLEDIFKAGHGVVISTLSAACLRLQAKQGAMVSALQSLFNVAGSKEKADSIFKCLIKFKAYDEALADQTRKVNIHGSVIVQNILKFNKPIFLINCILTTEADELAQIFSTPNGSFIADAFIDSKFVGEKSREKLVKHMEGSYKDMAITKFGSRVVDRFFEASNEAQKTKIVKELSDQSNQLSSTPFGRLLYNKFRIETFKLSPAQWKAGFDRTKKAEKLFKDIVA